MVKLALMARKIKEENKLTNLKGILKVVKKPLQILLLAALLCGMIAFPFLSSGCKPKEAGFYQNTTYGFSISYPNEWVEEETGGNAPIVQIHGTAGLPLVQIFLQYLPEVTTPSDCASQIIIEGLKKGLAEFEIISKGDIALGDSPGYEAVITYVDEQNNPVKSKMVFVLRGSQCFIIQALSTTADFDRNQKAIDEVIHSFRLEEPKPFGISREGTLTLYGTGPMTLDPALSLEMTSHTYIMCIFSGLIAFDQDLNLVPDIAEKWEVSGDGTTYTFHLREGVKFHNGREVKASDFKYSWERACNPKTGSRTAANYLGDIVGAKEMLAGKANEISGVEVVDNYTLRIKIDAPKSYFLAKLSYPATFVVDQANVESGKEWWHKPSGTGTFKLKKWEKDELIILERNDLYYGEPAKIKNIVFRLWGGIPMTMYETGEIDVSPVSLDSLDRVMDETNPLHEELLIAPELSISYIGFNTAEPPFDDLKVRQAFCRAVDKDKIISQVLKGAVRRADGILPPSMPGHNPNLQGLSYDLEKAKELIRESKYGSISNLPPITLTTSGQGSAIPDMLIAIMSEWKQNLGVEVEVRQLEPEDYYYKLKEKKDNLFIYGWVADYPDPQNILDILFHSGRGNNAGEYSNPEVDILLDEAGIEQDYATRINLYQEAEQMLVEDAACLPLWFSQNYILVKPYVKNYVFSPLGIPLLSHVYIEPH